jgi:hypothetical protein
MSVVEADCVMIVSFLVDVPAAKARYTMRQNNQDVFARPFALLDRSAGILK